MNGINDLVPEPEELDYYVQSIYANPLEFLIFYHASIWLLRVNLSRPIKIREFSRSNAIASTACKRICFKG